MSAAHRRVQPTDGYHQWMSECTYMCRALTALTQPVEVSPATKWLYLITVGVTHGQVKPTDERAPDE